MANTFGVVGKHTVARGRGEGSVDPFAKIVISERSIEVLPALVVNRVSDRGAAPHQARVTTLCTGKPRQSSTNSLNTIEYWKYGHLRE